MFEEDRPKRVYQYLVNFGMYRPNRQTKEIYKNLVEQKVWGKVQNIFVKYKKLWNGPDIPIYIFPFEPNRKRKEKKSGVSFPDKLFLFIGDIEDEKEIEALFIHEYHHVCRIHNQKKKIEEYTLLDSIIMEGLAEYTVKRYCGEQYNAHWCQMYKEKEIIKYWEEDFKENLNILKTEKRHDILLFGLGKHPDMAGYCLGYYLVTNYLNQRALTDIALFKSESRVFIQTLLGE